MQNSTWFVIREMPFTISHEFRFEISAHPRRAHTTSSGQETIVFIIIIWLRKTMLSKLLSEFDIPNIRHARVFRLFDFWYCILHCTSCSRAAENVMKLFSSTQTKQNWNSSRRRKRYRTERLVLRSMDEEYYFIALRVCTIFSRFYGEHSTYDTFHPLVDCRMWMSKNGNRTWFM